VPFRAPGRRQRARSRIRGAGSRSRAQRKVGPMARMASGILRRFGGRKLAVDVRLVVCLCGRLSAEVFRLATIGARMDEASPNAFGRSPGVTAEQASNVHQAPYRSLQLSHCSWRHGRSARPLIGRSERGQRHERSVRGLVGRRPNERSDPRLRRRDGLRGKSWTWLAGRRARVQPPPSGSEPSNSGTRRGRAVLAVPRH
jgi:hypothetical protein